MNSKTMAVLFFTVAVAALFLSGGWAISLFGGDTASLSSGSALKLDFRGGDVLTQDNVRPVAQLVVSVALLFAGLYIVLSRRFGTTERHWAFGALGTVIGFWLKG